MDPDRVIIAEILRPRGNKGELLVRSQSDVPGRLEELRSAKLLLKNGQDLELPVESSWAYRDSWVLKFAGIETISQAEPLAGAEIWVSRDERGSLPQGRYFVSDLIGCSLVNAATNQEIGPVTDYLDYGATPLLEVEHEGRAVLVPFVEAICTEVNLETRQVRAELPDGLLDL